MGSCNAFGLDSTRNEMLTICKSFDPVGDEIFRGLDLRTCINRGGFVEEVLPDVVDDGVLEPRHSEVKAFGVDFFLDAPDSVKHDGAVSSFDWGRILFTALCGFGAYLCTLIGLIRKLRHLLRREV
jgi:hypothetical protein